MRIIIPTLRLPCPTPLQLLRPNTTPPSRQYVTVRSVTPPPALDPTTSADLFERHRGFLARRHHRYIEQLSLDKWGWVIYRTSYKNEAAWALFRDNITRWAREELHAAGAISLVRDTAEWTFVSDPALEGAPHGELRTRFR